MYIFFQETRRLLLLSARLIDVPSLKTRYDIKKVNPSKRNFDITFGLVGYTPNRCDECSYKLYRITGPCS